MTFRSILATALAGLVLSTSVATTVEAATRRRPAKPMVHHPRRGTPVAVRRGGDAQNADVDRLNAQSLAAARGQGAPVAPTSPQ